MKYSLYQLLVIGIFLTINKPLCAQQTIQLSGQIATAEKQYFLFTDGPSQLIEMDNQGKYHLQLNVTSLPTPVYIVELSGNRIKPQTPVLWLTDTQNVLNFDPGNKAAPYQLQPAYGEQHLSEQIEKTKGSKRNELILKNAASLPSVYFLNEYKSKMKYAELAAIYAALSVNIKENNYGRELASYLSAKKFKSPKKGEVIQEFTVLNTSREPTNIASNHAKTRVIALLSPNCYYSFQSIDLLTQLHNHGQDKVEVVAIWSTANSQGWEQSKADKVDKLPWMLWDPHSFAEYYFEGDTSPTFLIIDKNGVVLDRLEMLTEKNINKLSSLL